MSFYEEVDHTSSDIDTRVNRFPYCIVWTPIPILTWILPFVGHMGIATSEGVVRDFAASYFVSEGDMAFGSPTRYIRLSPEFVNGGKEAYDRAVKEASDEYTCHIHTLCWDNCHSHVAMALNKMKYANKKNYNMFYLAALAFFKGKYVGFGGFLKQWLPSLVFLIFFISIFVISRV